MIQKIIMGRRIKIKKPVPLPELKKTFTIMNPEYIQACFQAGLKRDKWPEKYAIARYKTNQGWRSKRIPKFISFWKKDGDYFTFPRGSFFAIKKLYRANKIKYKLIDKRETRKEIPLKFQGQLDPERGQQAIKKFTMSHGIFKAPTGSGKTVMFLWLAAKIKQPTIILVDTERLLSQWVDEIGKFLGISKEDVGIIGGGKIKIKPVTVALIQSLHRKPELLSNFGLMGIDECPSVATETYGKCVDNFIGRYVIGLSATPKRNDGKTDVMKWYLGDIKISIKYEDAKRTPGFVSFVGTDFLSNISFKSKNAKAINEITEDKKRNKLIISIMKGQKNFPGAHIVLSHRVDHMKTLISLLPAGMAEKAVILSGETKKADRPEIIEGIKSGKYKYVFATHKMLGTGFDEPALSILYLVTPFKNEDGLKQYIGRVSRLHPDKKYFKIFDFFDRYHQELRGHASIRSKVYRKLKIKKNIIKGEVCK